MYFSDLMDDGFIFDWNNLTLLIIIFVNIFLFVISILTFNPIAISISAICLLILFIMLKFWDYINALFIKHSNFITLFNGYELAVDKSVAITKFNDIYHSIAIGYFIFEKDVEFDRDSLESIIKSNNIPFRFIINVEYINQERVLNNLETKKRFKEIQISNIYKKKNLAKIDLIKRDIEVLSHDIKSISAGKPIKLVYYIFTYGDSENKFNAQSTAMRNLNSISSSFSSAFKCSFRYLQGQDLIKFLKFDMVIEK